MQSNLTREQALALLKTYNKESFHIQHALTVEGVMRWYANELATAPTPITGPPWAFCTISTLKTGPRSTAGKPRSCCAPPAWART